MQNRRLWLLATSMIVGLGFGSTAIAQTAQPAQTQTQNQTSQSDEDEDATEVEEVVVTGSRIRRSEFTSAAPVQIISAENATLEGLADTAELLQQSTLASGSFQVNNQLTGFVIDGGPGVNTLSLRGLGAQRTLVILNGRRLGPAGVGGTVGPVDLNVIPQSIIQRVEILKDGASSVYGSDAVAGVANMITRTNLDGFEITAQATQPFETGGEQYNVNGAWGRTFDRGYANVAFDWTRQDALRRKDRDYTSCAADYLFRASGDPALIGTRIDYIDPKTGSFKCYNQTNRAFQVSGYGGSFMYREPGVVYPTNASNNDPFANPQLARFGRAGWNETWAYGPYDSKFWDETTVISPSTRSTIFATAGFDLTPAVEAYGELIWNRRESEQNAARQLFPSVDRLNPSVATVGALCAPGTVVGAPGLTGCIPALSDPDGGGPAPASAVRLTPIISTPYTFEQEVTYTRLVGGLRGELANNWAWDVFAQWSKSDADYTKDIIYRDRVLALTGPTQACRDGTVPGQPILDENGVATPNLSNFNCSAIPGGVSWFSQGILNGQWTDAQRAFLFGKEASYTEYESKFLEASISGDLFEMPAGPLGFALGVHYREEEIDDNPGPVSAQFNIWGLTSAAHTQGSDSVSEVFGELEIPLIRGVSFVESLTANVSARYSNYDSYGDNSTYKLGVNWQINPAWRLRATKGTSFRAPALYEQFLGGQTGFLGQGSIDPCIQWSFSNDPNIQANCAAEGVPADYLAAGSSSALIQVFGGTDLKPETSDAVSLGVIWTPEFMDLSVAVDYFEIEVEDEVTRFGADQILAQCYRRDPAIPRASDPFCALTTRQLDPALPRFWQITYVNDSYRNIASQENRGIDLTVRYEHEFSFGDLTFDGQFTWQLEDTSILLVGGATTDYNGTTFGYDGPDFSGQMSTRFERGDWTYAWSVDILGKGSDTELYGGDTLRNTRYVINSNGTSGVANRQTTYYKQYSETDIIHDFSVRREMDSWTITAGVLNAFGEEPPSASTGQFRVGTTALNGYDVRGRRGFVRVTKRW